MKHRFNIPDKINVGYNNRPDTYTGKLAYVVYTDEKGTLRKAGSWNNWRDHKIEPEEFDNVPTEGFVLNKKAGDYKSSWGGRMAWSRIYDPRGFEFEITIDNLLYILQECSSVKGKGLEGEFVYGWDKADLVLLPASSQEYQEEMAFKKAVNTKISKDDIKEGYCYLNKDGEELVYLGRHPYWGFHKKKEDMVFRGPRKCVFARLDKGEYQDEYFLQTTGFRAILAQIGTEPSPQFADKFDAFKKSKLATGAVSLGPISVNNKHYYDKKFVQIDGKYYQTNTRYSRYNSYRGWNNYQYKTEQFRAEEPVTITPKKTVIIPTWDDLNSVFVKKDTPEICLNIMNEAGQKIIIGGWYD